MNTSPLKAVSSIACACIVLLTLVPYVTHANHEPGHDLEAVAREIESSTAAQYQFKNEGIFGCNQVAGANASAGTMAAIGGVYVPVNDAAVTLNTGILVYKECVLRPLQDRLRESAVSALLKKQYIGVETGREGNPRYVVNQGAEGVAVSDKTMLAFVNDGTLDGINSAFQQEVKRAVIRNYQAETRSNKELECNYPGDLKADITSGSGGAFSLANFEKLADPACNPLFAYQLAKDARDARIAQALAEWQNQLNWGRGFYPVTDNSQDPLAEKVLTPASVLQESYQQILGSSVRQLENANDIGQMIGALFAGVTTQALTDTRGLAGLGRSVGGQPSYLDQVAKESSQGVIGAAVNAALQILRAYREFESRYLAAMNAIVSTLTQTSGQLRAAEQKCWDLIIPKAQQYASANGFEIQPATSTVFSQQVINSQIAPLEQAARTNIQNSQKALGLIDQIIAGVTNTASQNAVRLALQQLDNLVAQKSLHTQSDAVNAEKQRDDVVTAMETLRTDTLTAWGDSQDPSIGWCNIENANIPRLWAERWKK